MITLDGTLGITSPAETVQGALTTTGNTILGDSSADTLNVGNGGLVKDASGNVGIGTSSPVVNLNVAKSSDGVAARFQRSSGGGVVDIETYNAIGGIGTSDNIPFRLNTNNTERVRIDSSGRLLVGTSSSFASTAFLQVGTYQNGAAAVGFATKPSTNANYDAANFYNSAGSIVGYISCTASATTYATSSDYRLKENVAPMTGALDKVLQLKPVTYKWKSTGEESQGFIAHELQAVVPDCVVGGKDAVDAEGNPVHQGIDTSFLVATLTAAIQEQQALIIQLQADVATLKALSA